MKLVSNDLPWNPLLIKSLETLSTILQFAVTFSVFTGILGAPVSSQQAYQHLDVFKAPVTILASFCLLHSNMIIVVCDRGKAWDSSLWSPMTCVQNGLLGESIEVILTCLEVMGK